MSGNVSNHVWVEDATKPLGGYWVREKGTAEGAALVSESTSGIRLIDDTGTYVYMGSAPSGSATSASVWKIRRITSATGDSYPVSGEALAAWDDRATETYA